ncbi:MAG TPA: gluconate 2-dehydrogenase subunit 3 family protein [Chthoniobacterales bacterium]
MNLQNPPNSGDSLALTYLNDFEARTVEAIAERIIPADGAAGGATQAGVVYYIDRAISGFSTGLQRVYRLGLRELERFCKQEHSASFVDLTAQQQDDVVRRLYGKETGGDETVHPEGLARPAMERQEQGNEGSESPGGINLELLHTFFMVVREHTVEGYFCDPIYGGNRDAVGWRLVGFPGAQWGYTAEQMRPGFDATQIPTKTLSDLRRELKNLPNNEQFYTDGEK